MLGKTHFQNQNLVLKMGFFVNLYRIEVGKMKGNNEKKVIGHLARQDLNSVRLKKFCGILTIILSTALIIVVTLYFVQTQRFSIQDAEGRYQATFMDVNSKVVNKMKAMKNVEMGETRTLGTLNQGTYKITIRTMTESLLKLGRYPELKGKLPEMEKEVVVTDSYLEEVQSKAKIGDSIEIDLGDGKESYVIAGILPMQSTADTHSIYINELCISRSDNEHGQKEYKKNAILKILHTLEQKAFYGDDGQDINWIGITSIGNSENSSWNIQPLGVYLYEGLGGIALFYNALQQSDFDVDLSAACKAFETMMFQYTDDMLERSTDLEKESSGAYAGEASVIYVYEVLYKITGKQKYLEYAEKHCKILEYALKADENNDLIYGNAGAVIVLLNLYHLAQKDIYLQLACEAGNILIKNQNKGKWCCGNGQSLSGLSHGITGIIYALTKLNNEQFHIEYQKAIHSGLIYENTMYSDKYNNWLDNREEAKKEENSDNRCMAAWCHGAPGILLARSKMYNLVKDSSDYITVQCDIERALFATKMYGFTDNDCLCHGNLGNTEILLEYSKECNDEEVRHMMLSARTQIAMDIINENYDCARSYLHGYKIPGFMTGISGMGYSLLRDLYPELPCILALEI